MAYRLYLAVVDKKWAESFGQTKTNEFRKKYKEADSDYIDAPRVYDFDTLEEVHCLGSGVSQELNEAITGGTPVPFFQDPEVQELYEEDGLFKVGKDGLLALIEAYRINVIKQYEDLMTLDLGDKYRYSEDITLERKRELFIRRRIHDWQGEIVPILNLDENSKEKLVNSWDYEYEVLQLIMALKTIDWDKKELIYYGW